MPARPEEFAAHLVADASPDLIGIDTRQEDAYWSRHYWRERYYRADCEYEDYAPAYCAGYVGWAQYGGDYDDAEKSLCANWERIKGESRLHLEEARQAMHAAWDRMARMAARPAPWCPPLQGMTLVPGMALSA